VQNIEKQIIDFVGHPIMLAFEPKGCDHNRLGITLAVSKDSSIKFEIFNGTYLHH
jgi:hypothetical protein